MPCILVTFEKEQIVVWRGKDYQPSESECFLTVRESFDDVDGNTNCVDNDDDNENFDDECSDAGFQSGNNE